MLAEVRLCTLASLDPKNPQNGADTEYLGHVYAIYSLPVVLGTSVLLRDLRPSASDESYIGVLFFQRHSNHLQL